jgi:hypothetical protein
LGQFLEPPDIQPVLTPNQGLKVLRQPADSATEEHGDAIGVWHGRQMSGLPFCSQQPGKSLAVAVAEQGLA